MFTSHNIDLFKKTIDSEINLSDKLNQTIYKNNFYSHLSELLKYYLIQRQGLKEITFSKDGYKELEMWVLENIKYEDSEQELDWNYILDAKDILFSTIKSKLGHEKNSDELKPFIYETVDTFEKFLIFGSNATSYINPWSYAHNILKDGGCLHLVTDDYDVLRHYSPKTVENKKGDLGKNIGVLAASKKVIKKSETNDYSGLLIDNRYSTQTVVYRHLLEFAQGKNNAKSANKILEFLKKAGKYIDEPTLKNNVLFPLKRQGLIGSSNNGYYSITDFSDIENSFYSHLEKFKGIYRTLDIFALRAETTGNNTLRKRLNNFLGDSIK